MTKTNEHLSSLNLQENYIFSSTKPKTKFDKFGKQPSQPDLIVLCFICDTKFPIKYIVPKKRYSLKNLWNYWTNQKTSQKKYICNACLMRLHYGSMSDWITDKDKAGDFYQYVYRGQFK